MKLLVFHHEPRQWQQNVLVGTVFFTVTHRLLKGKKMLVSFRNVLDKVVEVVATFHFIKSQPLSLHLSNILCQNGKCQKALLSQKEVHV